MQLLCFYNPGFGEGAPLTKALSYGILMFFNGRKGLREHCLSKGNGLWSSTESSTQQHMITKSFFNWGQAFVHVITVVRQVPSHQYDSEPERSPKIHLTF